MVVKIGLFCTNSRFLKMKNYFSGFKMRDVSISTGVLARYKASFWLELPDSW